MAKSLISVKHLQISKASSTITIALAISSFVAVAALVSSRAMLQQRSYQSKVIKEKELAVKTLRDNKVALENLNNSYREFVDNPTNIIGGNTSGTGDRDGDNAKLILDALPSKYDFPALITSMEKVLRQANFQVTSITGTDDEVAQSSRESTSPEVIEIPFSFTISGSYDATHDLIATLERSIRPLHLLNVKFKADEGGVSLTVDAKSYYQSQKEFNVTTKAIQ